MKILVTGSTGFVGKNLVPRLILMNHEVLEVTRDLVKSEFLFGSKTQKLNVNDNFFKDKVQEFRPEIVLHLAAYLSSSDLYNDIVELLETNIIFTVKILDAVSGIADLKFFINTGTFAEYSKNDNNLIPAYFYSATKSASRIFVDYYSNNWRFKQSTVVPYTIYGGNDSQKKIIDLIIDSIDSDEYVDLTAGEQILDFIHIDDVIDFYCELISKKDKLPPKSNFHLGTGIGTSIKSLASQIEILYGKKTKINWGAKEYRKSDIMKAIADNSLAFQIFNWVPRLSLDDGLRRLIARKTNL